MTTALNTLLQYAERQRDETLAALLQTEALLRTLKRQAEQLQGYRDEYRQRNPALGGRTAGIEALRCHLDFMQRMEQAMHQQAGQLEGAEARCAVLRSELTAQELRVASVRKLLDRRGQAARVHTDRLEQRRSDEAAQNQFRRQADAAQGSGWRLLAAAAAAAH